MSSFFSVLHCSLPYELGIYTYVTTIIFFLIIFGDFGISTAATYFVAVYHATQREKLTLVLWNSGLMIGVLSFTTVVCAIMFGETYLGETYRYVLVVLPLVFLIPMASLFDGIYGGLKRFKALACLSALVGFVAVCSMYFLIKIWGFKGALFAQNGFYLLLCCVLLYAYRDFRVKMHKEVLTEIAKYSFIIGIGKIGLFLYTRIDVLFLGYYGYVDEISYYEILNRILMFILTPFTILSHVVAPNISAHAAKKEYATIYEKFKKYLSSCFILDTFHLQFRG